MDGYTLPRFMNRGLIEASCRARERRVDRELPRFMNRGLIEASLQGESRAFVVGSTSPIHESGPH